ncbi:MAG: 50S ribosomal protein L3 [Myxococcota bacterium]
MANEMIGLLGRKLGMTQLYNDKGAVQPVTVVEVGGNAVLRVKTADGQDGYNAIQLGFDEKKEARVNKAEKGTFDKAGVAPRKFIREIRLSQDDVSKYKIGQELGAADVFTEGELVDVTGISKGRGFAGVMKRHNFRGFITSHGTHEFFRHGGSIGTRLTPGHVLKGKKMPGHMGSEQVTVQNIRLVKIDKKRNLLFVRGGVPGPTGAYVTIRKAIKAKKPKA